MRLEIGRIEALFRYPVKSMRGERLEAATLGWQGLDGDRRFAFRRRDVSGDFPWLTAGKFPDLINFTPLRRGSPEDDAPTHVRLPNGEEHPLFGGALAAEVARRYGGLVEMMHLRHGIFDEATVSVISTETVAEICRNAGKSADVRRFRPNILIRTLRAVAFEEDHWVAGVLRFGDADDACAIAVTTRDVRCSMVNLDPEGGSPDPKVMKVVVRANENCAGVYGAVTRIGRLAIGQPVFLDAVPAAGA